MVCIVLNIDGRPPNSRVSVLRRVTPMLPNDWETMARPITYIMFDVASVGVCCSLVFVSKPVVTPLSPTDADNRNHSVSIYFDTTCMPVVSNEDTVVGFSRFV